MGGRSRTSRPFVLGGVLAALLTGGIVESAGAHTGLISSEPAAGSTLGAGPKSVRLTFSEEPEPSLSEVRVLDADGAPVLVGPLELAPGDPATLIATTARLPRGVYTVRYRSISAVDGHATTGAFAFGVRASPAGVVVEAPSEEETSPLDVVARWILLVGVVALLGAAVAGLAGFAGSAGSELRLAAAGWGLAALGLVLLVVAQRDAAGSSLGELLETPVGEALIWRAVALAACGAGLLAARRLPGRRRLGLLIAALGALALIVVHVDAGHAGSGGWSAAVTVSAQAAHFAAAGVWFGGLAALLLGVRGAPSQEKGAAVRAFAGVAFAALLVVVATGTLRAVDELAAWGDLASTGYGRAVLAKVALIAAIFGVAVHQRRRTVRAASSGLEPLRRASSVELGLALAALAVAALLGSLAPAVAGPAAAPAGLLAEGSDAAEAVRAELEAASAEPGPNSFTLALEDAESGEPLEADRVTLVFDPLDDPSVEETTLVLRPGRDGTYTGSGSNLAFDGRWEVTVQVEGGAEETEVPLELELPIPESTPSVLRLPGQPPLYTLPVNDGNVRIRVDPQREGENRILVAVFDIFGNRAPTATLVLTTSAGDGETVEQSVNRLTPSTFNADVELESGENELVAVARTRAGIRVRGSLVIEVPGG